MADSSLPAQIVIIVILVLVNAIFSAAELAFVSLNVAKIRQQAEDGDRRAQKVLKLLDNSDDFLATIQVAITLSGFLSSASAATSFVALIEPLIAHIPGASTIALLVVTIILSYVTLVLGELYPKQVALQMPEKIALATATLISVVQWIAKPFIRFLSFSTGILKKITPIEFVKEEEKLTRSEMKVLLDNSRNDGAIDLDEFTMMKGVLSLDSKLAREVMVPRTDTFMLDIDDAPSDNLRDILDTIYSRIPIYEEDKDNVIGIIHMKNVLRHAREVGFDAIDLRQIMTEPLFVPSTIYTDDLLLEFRRKQQHMAILKDEYGGVEGIVTLEDLLEEIVGEIEDESDQASRLYRKIDDHNYYIDGIMPIEKFNDVFRTAIASEEVDTIAGFILEELGYLPEDDEKVSVTVDNCTMTPTVIENGRIRTVHILFVNEVPTAIAEEELF